MSCSIGGGGSSGVTSLDVGQMDPATPKNSLGDVSLTTLLRGAEDSMSPSDYLNVSSIQDKDTQL